MRGRPVLVIAALAAGVLAAVALPGEARSAFPGANGKIVFVEGSGSGPDNQLMVMNADGSGQTALTPPMSGHHYEQPAWSPDGTKIAVSRDGDVYVLNGDGSGLTQLTTSGGYDPAWSPDGTKIAFSRGNPDIWVMNSDGSGQTQLTTSNGIAAYDFPAWSPDGSRILFTNLGYGGAGYWNGVNELFEINPDGTGFAQLTAATSIAEPDQHLFPDWSPDGGTIAFAGDVQAAETGVWLVDADGLNQRLLVPDLFGEPAWSPDGTKIAYGCEESESPFTTDICLANADGTGATQLTNSGTAQQPDWQPQPNTSGGDVAADCGDPSLAQLTTVSGNLVVNDVPGCDTISLPDLVHVGGSIDISDDTAATTIDITSLTTVGGNIDISDDTAATTIDITSLTTVGGNIDISDDTAATTIDITSLTTVGGNIDLENGGSIVDLGGAVVQGDVKLVANGSASVSAQTAGGATDVSVLGGTASMHVVLPKGALDQHVKFTIERQGDAPPEQGKAADGSPATVDPVGGYSFSFAVPTLNQQAQLSFTIDLSQLDAATRAALLAGAADGSATIAVKGDDPGAAYQAFARCAHGQTPAADGCVEVTLLDANGQAIQDPAGAVSVRFDGVAGHFSSWAVALVAPTAADTTPPAVTIELTAPNGGTPDGQHGWFVTGPVQGTVSADDSSTGGSDVSTLDCGPLILTKSGLGTPTATGSFSVMSDGTTQISCTATDSGGSTSPPTSNDVKLDRELPTVTYTGNAGTYDVLDPVAITCTPADTVSGIASSTCSDAETPAWTFGPGTHTLHATATDTAGNVGTGSTGFTVEVTIAGLCRLTTQFVQGSAKYRALSPAQKKLVDALAKALCNTLEQIVPKLNPAQTRRLVKAYEAGVHALVKPGWLTTNQVATLDDLAEAL